MSQVLITGNAGFIGAALAQRLLQEGHQVHGVDNLYDYYEVKIKHARLARLLEQDQFEFEYCDMADRNAIAHLFERKSFDVVVNLAAQAGVRYSIENPHPYVDTNLVGFVNILEGCRHSGVKHFVFASSSSVYGANTKQPFSEQDAVDHPISLYAASKKANEMLAHSYAHLYGLPCMGLRFFTVYGPWMRPDMALFKFARDIMQDQPIPVFNHGNMVRDFTYIDDIIEGVVRVMEQPASPDVNWSSDAPQPNTSDAPYKIFNIGNSDSVPLMRYTHALEDNLGKKAHMNMLPMQAGDMPSTLADTQALQAAVGFKPSTTVEEGVQRFAEWFKRYHAGEYDALSKQAAQDVLRCCASPVDHQ